jgi:hypothetical protein
VDNLPGDRGLTPSRPCTRLSLVGSTGTTADFVNPTTFAKISADQRTSIIGGQRLMNSKLQLTWQFTRLIAGRS